jgi:SPP1 gp7 family putative phage head morphogenesis protein
MAPTTMTLAGTTAKVEGEDQTPQLAKAMTATGRLAKAIRIRTGGKTAHSGAREMRKALTDAFKKALDTQEPAYRAKKVTELTHTEYMEHWKRFADRSEQAEADLKTIFRGINTKQREEVLENLPEATGVTKAVGELFNTDEWIAITIDLATPILTTLAKDEATAALQMIGAGQRDILADEGTQAALERGIAKMAKSYNETTLEQLKNVIGEKLTQSGGTSLTELTEAVDGVYSFADERRAGLIAKTESFRAANWANREAWVQSGVVKSLKWYTAEDDRVCAFCQELDGQEVGIEDKFFTDTYTNGETPPRHPDCRCYIRPKEISTE